MPIDIGQNTNTNLMTVFCDNQQEYICTVKKYIDYQNKEYVE